MLISFFFGFCAYSQDEKDIKYFLPPIEYDTQVPSPSDFFGNSMGTWHQSHDQVVSYFKTLSQYSKRMKWVEYGRTHENRPLIVGIFSNEDNLDNLDNIKNQHQKLSQSKASKNISIDKLPAILYQGYSVHGNEQSATHAALLVAYYLAAGKSEEIDQLLTHTVILIDPCLNPDGSQRFTTWVNSHKSKTLVSDPSSREFSEVWPGGRYNHYWFDLNRDWLLLVHPESRARIQLLQEWHPSVVGDYHEMGTNSTYFFQPGVPSRNNPNTPDENFRLTEKIAQFHARDLDSIGTLYFTKTNFDDFYYGKGSTYPEATGTIGILFEQASSRGHLQESIYGPLSFRKTIKNQVVTSLSTQKGVLYLRKEILQYKKNFHELAKANKAQQTRAAYIYTDQDKEKLFLFTQLLLAHNIEVYHNNTTVREDGLTFEKGKSFIVPLDQNQPILAQTMFEEVKSFKDSLFYDVSGWTVAHGYGIDFKPLTSIKTLGPKTLKIDSEYLPKSISKSYAYVIPSGQYNLHKAAYQFQNKGIKVLYTQTPLNYKTKTIESGSLIIQSDGQGMGKDAIHNWVKEITHSHHLETLEMQDGNGVENITLGHPLIYPLKKPEVAFFVGPSITPQSAGQVWHHLDVNLNIPATSIDLERLSSMNINRYNTLVMPSGQYSSWSEKESEIIKNWVRNGNTLIVMSEAGHWLQKQNILGLKAKKKETPQASDKGNYASKSSVLGAQRIGGSVFQLDIDTTHPLFYGITSDKFYTLKRGTQFYETPTNSTATAATYSKDFLASGYVPKGLDTLIPGSAAVTVHGLGSGRIIYYQDDVLFRGYWKNGEKTFNNALFWGLDIASHSASEE